MSVSDSKDNLVKGDSLEKLLPSIYIIGTPRSTGQLDFFVNSDIEKILFNVNQVYVALTGTKSTFYEFVDQVFTGYAFNCTETCSTISSDNITHIGIPASTASNKQSVFASRVTGRSGSEALLHRENPIVNLVRCWLPDNLRTARTLNDLGIFFYVEGQKEYYEVVGVRRAEMIVNMWTVESVSTPTIILGANGLVDVKVLGKAEASRGKVDFTRFNQHIKEPEWYQPKPKRLSAPTTPTPATGSAGGSPTSSASSASATPTTTTTTTTSPPTHSPSPSHPATTLATPSDLLVTFDLPTPSSDAVNGATAPSKLELAFNSPATPSDAVNAVPVPLKHDIAFSSLASSPDAVPAVVTPLKPQVGTNSPASPSDAASAVTTPSKLEVTFDSSAPCFDAVTAVGAPLHHEVTIDPPVTLSKFEVSFNSPTSPSGAASAVTAPSKLEVTFDAPSSSSDVTLVVLERVIHGSFPQTEEEEISAPPLVSHVPISSTKESEMMAVAEQMRLGGIALVGAPSTEGDSFDIHHSLESLPAEAQRNERKIYISFNTTAWYEILAIGADFGWPTGKSFALPLPGGNPSEDQIFGTPAPIHKLAVPVSATRADLRLIPQSAVDNGLVRFGYQLENRGAVVIIIESTANLVQDCKQRPQAQRTNWMDMWRYRDSITDVQD
ncbi:hypothetical protein SeMB42_g02548 [Synchytrium endobioticum]|uniref:Uncharacterized protein n=1 Tax=Synchytrium endobioticum TaxID=286115 RepID=A0A507DD34_9FUNG|nr:hypothetical protein SeMB42_g02548 [Synchytrium endobioticum]